MNLPPLWELFDKAHDFVKHSLPSSMQDNDIALAIGEGITGGSLGALVVAGVTFSLTPCRYKKYLPVVYDLMAYATALTVPVVSLFKPEALKTWVQQHPVYTYGTGFGIGSAAFTFHGLANMYRRNKQ